MDGKEELSRYMTSSRIAGGYTKGCILRADLKTIHTGRE